MTERSLFLSFSRECVRFYERQIMHVSSRYADRRPVIWTKGLRREKKKKAERRRRAQCNLGAVIFSLSGPTSGCCCPWRFPVAGRPIAMIIDDAHNSRREGAGGTASSPSARGVWRFLSRNERAETKSPVYLTTVISSSRSRGVRSFSSSFSPRLAEFTFRVDALIPNETN